jgi:hypothetical protein
VRVRGDDPKDLVYIGERYDLSNFALPPPPPVNEAAAEVSLAEYEALKARMLSDTLLFGATGSAAAALFAGPEQVSGAAQVLEQHPPKIRSYV